MNRCILCTCEAESNDHTMFKCSFSRNVWNEVFSELNLKVLIPASFSDFQNCTDKSQASTSLMVISNLWKERNHRIFSELFSTVNQLT